MKLLLLALFLTATPVATLQPDVLASPYPYDFRVLVFSRTLGFRHSSIPTGIQTLQDMGQAHHFEVIATEDPAVFRDEVLQNFEVIVFLNTTGDVLDAAQQAAFERFIRSGKGFVGIHAAADTEYDWPFYSGLIGAYFASHPAVQTATVKVIDRTHPSTAMLPARWVRTDEWYNFRSNPYGKVHVLAVLDETSYSGGSMGSVHPIAWCQVYEGGRSWYTAGGHTEAAYQEPLFQAHLLEGIRWAAGQTPGNCNATVERNFAKIVLEDEVDNPMDLEVLPDGRLLFIERGGDVHLHDPTTGRTTLALHLNVFTGNEDGLLGIALDPHFLENNWVYLFYSPATGPARQQVSRFTFDGTLLDATSEVVLLEIPTQREQCCHAAGSMVFDPQGNLYIATGDNTNPFESDGYAPIDGRPGRAAWDARRTAGNPFDLRGKILRIRPQPDGSYTIPEGNLFNGQDGAPEVYVMGVRNPFRIAFDPVSAMLYWGDVGPDAWSDNPRRGPRGYDEWNRTSRAGNFGWPFCIADNQPYLAYDFATGSSGAPFDCAAPVNDSPHISYGPLLLPPAQPAWIWYPYGSSTTFPEIPDGTGRTALAGPIYRRPAQPGHGALPPFYEGVVFLLEWSRSYLLTAHLDENGSLLAILPFLPGIPWKRPIAMKQGPDGALYVIEWGTSFWGGNQDAQLVKLLYQEGGRAPVVQIQATPTSGPLPLVVHFSSAGTYDPDAEGPLTYAWDFTDDGTIDATTPEATFTYTQAGTYVARLIVTDASGLSGNATVTLIAGNTLPEITIETPVDGGIFDWGQVIPFRVRVTDAEDGTTEDGTIACETILVQPFLGHDDHSHPLEQLSGCEGSFQTVTSHGTEGDNLYYLLQVTYTDRGSEQAGPLTGWAGVKLYPRRVEAEHATEQVGTVRTSTSDPLGGRYDLGQIDHGDYIAFSPMNLAGISFVTFHAASASEGGRIEVRAQRPNGPLLGTAYIPPSGSWQTYTDVTIPLAPFDQTTTLYFVFLRNPGNTGLFNLNWIQFHGPGVTRSAVTKQGLRAQYFTSRTLSGPARERLDPQISFNWAAYGPFPDFPTDSFSVRWTGFLEVEQTDTYILIGQKDDGLRVWLNGNLVINRWQEGPQEVRSQPIFLEGGRRYPLTVEYFEAAGHARVRLMWQSASMPAQTIPERLLFTDATGTTQLENAPSPTEEVTLHSPFPNPFSGAVQLGYTLPHAAEVRLFVYDLLGRRVAVLQEAWQAAGVHHLQWRPEGQASGFYIVWLEAAGKVRRQAVMYLP